MQRQPKKGSFPRLSLTAAIKIIKEANQIKGKISKATFAQFGARKTKNPSITSGAFNDKINALRSFGLITIDNENIELTERAIKIIDPIKPEEAQKALLQCFIGIGTFKALLDTLEIETPVNQTILQEQAVNTIGINRNQRKKFVDLFVSAADKVGLVSRVDKNTIKRKTQTVMEEFANNTVDIFSLTPLHKKLIGAVREDSSQKSGAASMFYPYTDNGPGWQIEIKITSNKNLSQEVRNMRSKLGELLGILNSGNDAETL